MLCPACESESAQHTSAESDSGAGSEICHEPYRLLTCRNCGLGFCDPMEIPKNYYENLYGEVISKHNLNPYALWHKTAEIYHRFPTFLLSPGRRYQLVLSFLKCFVKPSEIVLDIGCGQGYLLHLLKKNGYEPVGFDISETMIAALKRLGYEAYSGRIEDYPKIMLKPKAVILSEVLEHLPTPFEMLQSIRKTFPESILFITVPSPKRLNLIIRKKHEPSDYPPHHLTRWTEKSLKIILQRAGFEQTTVAFPLLHWKETFLNLGTRCAKALRKFQPAEDHALISIREGHPLLTALMVHLLFFPKWIISRVYQKQGVKSDNMVTIAK